MGQTAALLILAAAFLPACRRPQVQDRFSVRVAQSGITAEACESTLAVPLEKAVEGLLGQVEVASYCRRGGADLIVTYADGLSPAVHSKALHIRIAQLHDLPGEARPPAIFLEGERRPVLTVAVADSSMTVSEMTAFADQTLVPALQAVSGVSEALASGDATSQVKVRLDPRQLWAHDLSVGEVVAALGKADRGDAPITPRGTEFSGLDVLGAEPMGKGAKLRDLAVLEDGLSAPSSTAWLNGERAIVVSVRAHTGVDGKALTRTLEDTALELKLPHGMRLVFFPGDDPARATLRFERPRSTPGELAAAGSALSGRLRGLTWLRQSFVVAQRRAESEELVAAVMARDDAGPEARLRRELAEGDPSLASALPVPDRSFLVAVHGPESEKLREIAETLETRLKGVPGVAATMVSPQRFPAIRPHIDPVRAASLGVKTAEVDLAVRVAGEGEMAAYYGHGRGLRVFLEASSPGTDPLEGAWVRTGDGRLLAASALAKRERLLVLDQIFRRNGEREATVVVEVDPQARAAFEKALTAAMQETSATLPPGYSLARLPDGAIF